MGPAMMNCVLGCFGGPNCEAINVEFVGAMLGWRRQGWSCCSSNVGAARMN